MPRVERPGAPRLAHTFADASIRERRIGLGFTGGVTYFGNFKPLSTRRQVAAELRKLAKRIEGRLDAPLRKRA